MTAEQITSLMLDLYAARPEAKEYLDFFVNPDIDAKLDKARTAIAKEMQRTSKGRSNIRISRVKQQIKNIATLDPGPEAVCEIMTSAFELISVIPPNVFIKEPLQISISRLMSEAITLANTNGLLNIHLPRIEKTINDMPSSFFRVNHFKKLLSGTLKETVESLAS